MRRLVAAFFVVAALPGCTSNESPAVVDATPASTDDATTIAATPMTISVIIGENSAPDRIETVALGTSVQVEFVNPDTHDEFHLHGYDLSTGTIEAGETATISFTADKSGTFEIESHETDAVVVVLEIR